MGKINATFLLLCNSCLWKFCYVTTIPQVRMQYKKYIPDIVLNSCDMYCIVHIAWKHYFLSLQYLNSELVNATTVLITCIFRFPIVQHTTGYRSGGQREKCFTFQKYPLDMTNLSKLKYSCYLKQSAENIMHFGKTESAQTSEKGTPLLLVTTVN